MLTREVTSQRICRTFVVASFVRHPATRKNCVTVPRANRSLQLCTDPFCSLYGKKNSGCFSLPVHCSQPGVRMTPPMLPRIIHIITADIEEEVGDKASPAHRRRRAAFDSACKPKQDPNQ